MSIQRWKPFPIESAAPTGMVGGKDGDYILVTDHQAEMQKAREEAYWQALKDSGCDVDAIKANAWPATQEVHNALAAYLASKEGA